MAHNPVIRGVVGSGLWIGVVSAGEWELFDQRQFQSINGDLGGTWAPSSIIIIGGSGLRTTGIFEANGTFTSNAAATFNSNVTIKANSSYWNVQTIDGANTGELKFTSGALLTGLAGATATWASGWTFNGTVTFNAKPTINAALDVTGLATFSGTVATTGTLASSVVTVATSLTMLSGASVLNRYLIGPDANTTIAAGTYDRVRVTTLTANRTYTLAAAPNGTEIIFAMSESGAGSGTNQCNINNEAAVQIAVLKYQTAGALNMAHCIVRGGSWEVFDSRPYAIT